MPASNAACSFSKMRGTEKNHDGRASGREPTTSRAFGQSVTVKPNMIGRYCEQERSAMCAIGRYDTTEAPAGNWMIWSNERPATSSFLCMICTPLGGPVVPEV